MGSPAFEPGPELDPSCLFEVPEEGKIGPEEVFEDALSDDEKVLPPPAGSAEPFTEPLEPLSWITVDDFPKLYERYRGKLYSYLHRLTRDSELTLDLLQDTFLSAYSSLAQNQNRPIEKPNAWIYRIATNKALDALNKRRRHADEPYPEDDDHAQDMLLRTDVNMTEELEQSELLRAIRNGLPRKQWLCLLLTHYHGFSHREAGHILGMSEQASKMLANRARLNARQLGRAFLDRDN